MSELSNFLSNLKSSEISLLRLDEYRNFLEIVLADGDVELIVRDDGQQCCEDRYITTDDDLSHFVGADLLDIEVRHVSNGDYYDDSLDWYYCHDIQFVIVNTSVGSFTLETHNVHNGYYGGFWIVVEVGPGYHQWLNDAATPRQRLTIE